MVGSRIAALAAVPGVSAALEPAGRGMPTYRSADARSFDRVAEITARALDIPIALVILRGSASYPQVDGCFGTDRESVAPAADARLVADVIALGGALVIPDGRENPSVALAFEARRARSYVGFPIVGRDHTVFGVLGVFDVVARSYGDEQIAVLGACARFAAEKAMRGRASPAFRRERRLALLRAIVDASNVPMAVSTSAPTDDAELLFANEPFARTFGFEAAALVGAPARIAMPGDNDLETLALVANARRRFFPVTFEYLGRRKNGVRFWCESTIAPVFVNGSTCEAFVTILRDVTARRSAEQILRQDRDDVLELIARDAPLDRIFDALVGAAERSRPGVAASITLQRGRFVQPAVYGSWFGEALAGRKPAFEIVDVVTPGAQVAGIRACVSTPIRNSAGDVVGTFAQHLYGDAGVPDAERFGSELAYLAGIAVERRLDRERLEFLAHHDALTGLPNRVLFETKVREALAVAAMRGRQVAIVTCDLAGYKLINDSLGHAAGDELLRAIGARLERAARPRDTVGRLGGDEFVVAVDDIESREDAARIARRLLLELSPSFTLGSREVFVRASMGIALFPDDGDEPSTLLSASESAMTVAQVAGLDVAFFEKDEPDAGRGGIARIELEAALRYALERDELFVLFQPLVDLRTREPCGAEALVRWRDPVRGIVMPDAFIRAAEETGLIVPIGAWVLERACRFARRWQDAGLRRFVAVNVSARQFDRPGFVAMVTDVLERTGLVASRLHLEVTESLLMRSPERAIATLTELKGLGVEISIDDFGTGYSSFNYLKRFPLDALKVDRLFVRDIGSATGTPGDEAIVRAIVSVARTLGLTIVAEGIETAAQEAFMLGIGVPIGQGFLFSPALPADDAFAWTCPEV